MTPVGQITRTGDASVDVTVIIPTFNGEKYLGQLLDALAAQQFDGQFEVLIIDSGSNDRTLDIIHRRAGRVGPAPLRLHEIPQSEFGHGTTRNLGAQMANGTYLVYLSHDAVPIGASWLSSITSPLRSPGVVAVVARHIPRSNCPPLLKYEIEGVFDACGRRDAVTLERLTTQQLTDITRLPDHQSPSVVVSDFERRAFYSDVASATIREFILHEIPYRDLPYSEDMAFGRDVLLAGYGKVYTPLAPVEHSNDVTFSEYAKRIFDETLGLRRLGKTRERLSWGGAVARAIYGALKDSPRIVRDRDDSWMRKLGWLAANPWWQWRKWMSIRRAITVDLSDTKAIARYSLEAERARRA